MNMKMGIVALGVLAAAGAAQGSLQITEAYVGLSGEDGTADWIEITNFGAPTSLSGLFYDDSSADNTEGGDLPAINLATGESLVVLVDIAAVDAPIEIALFEQVWGAGINVVATGGGALGQGGDVANLLDGTNTVLESLSTPDINGDELFTWEDADGDGVGRFSVLGENGAFESNLFFNDNIGPSPDFLVSLVGSPGQIPAPGAVALAGVAGLAGLRRRRNG